MLGSMSRMDRAFVSAGIGARSDEGYRLALRAVDENARQFKHHGGMIRLFTLFQG